MEQLGFSKINLGLSILRKRNDGYHDIDTIFQSIFLGDSLYFAKHHSIVFSGDSPELPYYMSKLIPYDESNLAMKALRLLQDYTKCTQGAAIHLLKRVPAAAGLGGGSADAAAMLLGLNKFWDLQLTSKELLHMASQLGSDVPFLLRGGTARGTGRGELLKYIETGSPHWLLIVKPELSISTADAYHRFNGHSNYTSQTIDNVEQSLFNGDMKQAFLESGNTFEELLFPIHPELKECKNFFESRGFPTIMTGSGPTIVVYLEKAALAIKLQQEIQEHNYSWLTLITKTHGKEDLLK